jgi:hypothetical protein
VVVGGVGRVDEAMKAGIEAGPYASDDPRGADFHAQTGGEPRDAALAPRSAAKAAGILRGARRQMLQN